MRILVFAWSVVLFSKQQLCEAVKLRWLSQLVVAPFLFALL
jgi:hypothetical protein